MDTIAFCPDSVYIRSINVVVKEQPLDVSSDASGVTIRVVATRTGLPMDTLRAWERRYGFPKPVRRAGSNRRLYCESDIERLLAMTRTFALGYRVGDVVGMTLPALRALSGDGADPAPAAPRAPNLDALVDLLRGDDVAGFERELRGLATQLGPKRFVTDVAHPFAVRVGEAWAAGRLEVRHEHMASEILTTQLRHMLAGYQDVATRPQVLLATLPGEPHTLALQMVALYLAVSGAKARLLGASTPPEDLAAAALSLHADVVGLTVTLVSDPKEARRGVKKLLRRLPAGVTVWLGGAGAAGLGLDVDEVRCVPGWNDLDDALERWRAGPQRGARVSAA